MDARQAVRLCVAAAAATVGLAFALPAAATVGKPKPPPFKITPPANITVEATGPGGAVVVFRTVKSASVVSTKYSRKSGSRFPLGTTVVTITAKDRLGRTAHASFKVRVVDTTPPKLEQPADVTKEAASVSGATVVYAIPAALDLVSGSVTPVCAPGSGSSFRLGTTTVTCTARDGVGNTASVTFTVKVVDTTPPTIATHPDVSASATSATGAAVSYSPPSATDAATAVPSVTCTPPSGSVFPIGTTTVTCTARDLAGNTASSSFRVAVTPMPAVPGSYSGTTSQGKPITFTVSSDGRRMTNVSVQHTDTCPGGMSLSATFTVSWIDIAADGSFSDTGSGTVSGSGTAGTFTASLSGNFVTAAASASGTFAMVQTLTAPVSTACSSGAVTWTASRVG